MRRPSRRALPTVIGVSVVTTLAANLAVVLANQSTSATPNSGQALVPSKYVAASTRAKLAAASVAPLRKRVSPDVLVAAPSALTDDTIAKIRRVKGVRGAEVVDAAQVMVAGKRVGLLGVEPSSFRNLTPGPTAKSDALWRNISAGDVAISFTMGNDGGVKLGSFVPAGSSRHQNRLRVGAYATMGMSDVDAVVSHSTARAMGLPSGNALLISAPKADAGKLIKRLGKWLPGKAKAVEVNPKIDYPRPGGKLPAARGQVMNAEQVRTVIRAAHSRLNWPYVWGGESEQEGGYDCSGLMLYAFGQAGIRLPRVAADQARAGWVVPFNKAQPGDMLIWANDPTAPGYISHIALYLGRGKMIAAPRTGTVVQIQQVYLNNLRGAVRVNPRIGAQLAG